MAGSACYAIYLSTGKNAFAIGDLRGGGAKSPIDFQKKILEAGAVFETAEIEKLTARYAEGVSGNPDVEKHGSPIEEFGDDRLFLTVFLGMPDSYQPQLQSAHGFMVRLKT